jgi:PHD/YefM family antitoxin component YafN of YafNO toxin-antitoxin module
MRPTNVAASLLEHPRRVLRAAAKSRRPYVVSLRGMQGAVILNRTRYERMERELLQLREESRIAQKVRRAEGDIRAGRMRSGDLRDLLVV